MNSVKTSQIWQHSISFQMKYLHSESRAEFVTVNEFSEIVQIPMGRPVLQ